MEKTITQTQLDPASIDLLEDAIGALCELRSMHNDLLFVGRIQAFDGDTLTIYASGGGQVPPVVFNTEFKLHIRAHGRSVTVWSGAICGSSRTFWKLDRLERYSHQEHRQHFRQRAAVPAEVLCINSLFDRSKRHPERKHYRATQARLVDISLGGVQVRSAERFERGDWLLLTGVQLLPNAAPFVFTCQVCWADRAGPREFTFGCRFTTMSAQEQDRLCSGIFTLQRLDLQKHKGEDL